MIFVILKVPFTERFVTISLMISEKKQLKTKSKTHYQDYTKELVKILSNNDMDILEKLNKSQPIKNKLGVELGLFVESVPNTDHYGSETIYESRREIIETHGIINHEEMMLVDLMLSSYHRALKLEEMINKILFTKGDKFSINENSSKIIDRLYKAIERANNQYIRAVTTLHSIRRPQPTINIKSQNTVFGKQEVTQNNDRS